MSSSVSVHPLPSPAGSVTAIGSRAVLIPVKGFSMAKRRLGGSMSDVDRINLVRSMATHVVTSCLPLPVAVVCDDPEVAEWATDLGAIVMWEPGLGLNGAVRSGVEQLRQAGVEWVTVAHGDLPQARGIGALSPFDGVTLAPDRVDDGTNVLRVPTNVDFAFSYGAGSFRTHLAESLRIGLPVRVLRVPALAYDVDWPADVMELPLTTKP